MSFPIRYWLPAAWVLLFGSRLMGASDPATLLALRLLTLAILVAIFVSVVRFVEEKIRSARHGERILTESTLRGLLVGGLILGFVLRIAGWDHGQEGVLAWIGGIMILLSLAGLMVLGFLSERARMSNPSFYFSPNWKYGLALICIATLTIQGLAQPEGAASSLNVLVFWVALITLIVQTVGRWILRWRGDGSGARPVA